MLLQLGNIDKTWASRSCPLCRLIAAVCRQNRAYPAPAEYELRRYSSTEYWICQQQDYCYRKLRTGWIDTVFLAVINTSRSNSGGGDFCPELDSGFIGRMGTNCPSRSHAVTVVGMDPKRIDFKVVREWLDCCTSTHSREHCNPEHLEPIPNLRLIDCVDRKLITPTSSLPFVALSYVWGPGPIHNDQSKEAAVVEHAEAVVQDAMLVTQMLGYRYLWVDRYCIDDQNKDVMHQQLRSMSRIYRNSELTVVAAAGVDSSFGLPGVAQRPRKAQLRARIQGHILTSVPPDPITVIDDAVWSSRGWTYQEGLLSRRRLFFTENEVSFECRKLLAREALTLPMQTDSEDDERTVSMQHESWLFPPVLDTKEAYCLFERLNEYSRRRLTYDSDILDAILGMM
ncbi:heterokaryon incompatibility protein-domain-containing protein [Xylariaceae sp. FL1272]|nr:heterokaryon incompatibility protein-domain-containing protein [Xylariaceae sp. FL1272]